MSLINEALRKARQAASEHDSKQAEGPFRPAKAYPSRRSGRRSGLLTMVLIALAAGAVGAAAAWWFLGDRQEPPQVAVGIERATETTDKEGLELGSSPAPAELRTEDDTTGTSAAAAPTPMTNRPEDSPAEAQPVADTEVVKPAPRETDDAERKTASGERVFVMEAELGEVTLSLGFIVARPDNPFAEINGIEVSVGSEIEGFVVEAIEADRVILRDDKGSLVLRVP